MSGDSQLSATITETPPGLVQERPLCVDLDGTLVKSDTLVDSLLILLRRRPMLFVRALLRIGRGKAAVKEFVTRAVVLDVGGLPYNREVLRYLEEERGQGRPLYLVTGADLHLAARVAEHLRIFTGVLASNGGTNLTGVRKLAGLRAHFGPVAYDYIGNDTQDLPLLAESSRPMVANPSHRLRLRMRARGIQPVRQFEERKGLFASIFKVIRPHQWTKNLLMFLPMLLAHRVQFRSVLSALFAFACFCLTASATYMINDLLDIEVDRRHPQKRLRPFASGDLPAVTGFLLIAVFLVPGFAGAELLPARFMVWLAIYVVMTLAYSLWLKRVALADVLMLSGLYLTRIEAGGAATRTLLSNWMVGFSIFLFLALAFVKRFAELENLRLRSIAPRNDRGYHIADLEQLRAFGTSSSYAAVVIFAIYINGRDVMALYHHPSVLWLIVPLQILWLSRVWLFASRGELDEDPVIFALTDRLSLLIGAAVAAVAICAL
jgi:4-hydroxybenzoate polyprenyltransferase/phosphoserine phosphatase